MKKFILWKITMIYSISMFTVAIMYAHKSVSDVAAVSLPDPEYGLHHLHKRATDYLIVSNMEDIYI